MPAQGAKSLPIRDTTHHKIKLLCAAERITMQEWIDRAASVNPTEDRRILDIVYTAKNRNPEATRLILEALRAL